MTENTYLQNYWLVIALALVTTSLLIILSANSAKTRLNIHLITRLLSDIKFALIILILFSLLSKLSLLPPVLEQLKLPQSITIALIFYILTNSINEFSKMRTGREVAIAFYTRCKSEIIRKSFVPAYGQGKTDFLIHNIPSASQVKLDLNPSECRLGGESKAGPLIDKDGNSLKTTLLEYYFKVTHPGYVQLQKELQLVQDMLIPEVTLAFQDCLNSTFFRFISDELVKQKHFYQLQNFGLTHHIFHLAWQSDTLYKLKEVIEKHYGSIE